MRTPLAHTHTHTRTHTHAHTHSRWLTPARSLPASPALQVFFGENLPSRFFRLADEDFAKCDLLIVMGTSLLVQPFASLIGRVKNEVPRLLINRMKVGTNCCQRGFRFEKKVQDVFFKGDCDEGVERLAGLMGWTEDLKSLRERG